MRFYVYIVILLVAISSILLELDWLTKPKLETKAQTASTAVLAAATRAKDKTAGPNEDLSPVYPKKTDVRLVGSVTGTPQPAETAGAGSASAPAVAESSAKAEPKAEPPQKPAAETTGAATPSEPAAPSTAASARASVASNETNTPRAAAPTATPPVPAANLAASNRCDVQACSGVFQSFRASDCTYQPFEGPRRVCERPPGTGQKVASQPREPTARRSNKDAELREGVRRVKQITVPADEADDEDDSDSGFDDSGSGFGESRVILIERPARRPR